MQQYPLTQFGDAPITLAVPEEDAALQQLLHDVPRIAAIFLIDVGEGQSPYLARTANLQTRLKRLLGRPKEGTRTLSLQGLARAVHYWPNRNALASALLLWELARPLYPARYKRMLGLRPLHFVSLLADDPFPRVVATRRPADERFAFGPFLRRGDAESFLDNVLPLFLLRRCDETLQPSPSHAGCIYGEMALCLRPCQDLTVGERYKRESETFQLFLQSSGESLKEQIELERDQASESMDFEAAARHHKRLTRLSAAFASGNRLARHLPAFHGFAVAPKAPLVDGPLAAEPSAAPPDAPLGSSNPDPDTDQNPAPLEVEVWPVWNGCVLPSFCFQPDTITASALSALVQQSKVNLRDHCKETKQELLTVLLRWIQSSWCDGEWLPVDDLERPPLRKLRNAALRLVRDQHGAGTKDPETPDKTGG